MEDTKWIIDPAHSAIQFKVRHLVISTVTGLFKNFEGAADTKGDSFEKSHISVFVDTGSIDTNQGQRDTHLKSSDFFYTEKYPKLKFISVSVKKINGEKYEIIGDLTIKETTKKVTLEAEYGGMAIDSDHRHKVGFEIIGKINRRDFGLTWNALTETGGLTVGEDIKIIANIQFIKQI